MAPESALLAGLVGDADVNCANAVAFGANVGVNHLTRHNIDTSHAVLRVGTVRFQALLLETKGEDAVLQKPTPQRHESRKAVQ